MKLGRQTPLPEDSDPLSPAGPYDRVREEEDLWFLSDDPDEPTAPPIGPGPQNRLLEPQEWRVAEAGLAGPLAALCHDHGRLDERLTTMGEGARERLARAEAVALGWWAGDRVGADRLALWLGFRIGAASEEVEALVRTAWSARRLGAPRRGDGIGAVFGDDAERLAPLIADAQAELSALEDLHPVTRGCALFRLWGMLEERPDPLRRVEAAVLGARIAGQGGSGFLPVSMASFSGLSVTGPPERRLAAWVEGAHQGVLAALLLLERLRAWERRAVEATADLSGRTPARLIACLMRHPMVTAPMAEADTQASRAAVQRNLDQLQGRGLVREITGQGRFRVWTARA